MTCHVPTSAAERQREYRARDKSGSLWASAFVPRDLAEKLIEGGLLPESESSDKKSLGAGQDEAAAFALTMTALAFCGGGGGGMSHSDGSRSKADTRSSAAPIGEAGTFWTGA